MRRSLLVCCFLALWVRSLVAGVTVSVPANGSTVSSTVQYVAAASSPSCSKGVSALGIYTAPGQLAYVAKGSSLNTVLSLSPGTYHTTVQEWDNCGWSATAPVTITVGGGSGAGVMVAAPANNSQVISTVNYVASATTSCSRGVAAMGIYTAPNQLAFTTGGSSLNTHLSLSPGTHHTTVQEWDKCGGTASTPITITVNGSNSGGGTFWSLQANAPGWTGYGLLPPNYAICSTCSPSGPNVTWSWTPGITNPSSDGKSVKTTIGGTQAYTDVLWNNHLIGDFSSQGLPDSQRTLVPTLHNFTYDVWFYLSDNTSPQALEFDINQFVNGKSYIWGHECRVAGGNQWDTWSNPGQYWVPSGIGCWPKVGWNHLVLQVQRTSDGHLLFQSISLNGTTNGLNRYDTPTPTNWYGVTINYQIDGNTWQSPYAVYLDKLNFTWLP